MDEGRMKAKKKWEDVKNGIKEGWKKENEEGGDECG